MVSEHKNNNGIASFTVEGVMEECSHEKSKYITNDNSKHNENMLDFS
ncbi:MAG: hypothetical protein SOY42_12610 [Clostridium sp.]|nr:hypothetical protein [Clostridium sp.]